MTGDQVKALREAKCWSQAHLAEAAGLNIRTVQRIEAGEPCAPETMLSLAAALDVEISKLGRRGDDVCGASGRMRARLALSAALVAPAGLFVAVNLLRSTAGIGGPYDLLATTGGKLMDFETFNRLSPMLFVGGSAAALALTLPTLVRFRAKTDRGILSISGIDLIARPAALVIACLAVVTTAALLLYAAAEQLRPLIS